MLKDLIKRVDELEHRLNPIKPLPVLIMYPDENEEQARSRQGLLPTEPIDNVIQLEVFDGRKKNESNTQD